MLPVFMGSLRRLRGAAMSSIGLCMSLEQLCLVSVFECFWSNVSVVIVEKCLCQSLGEMEGKGYFNLCSSKAGVVKKYFT